MAHSSNGSRDRRYIDDATYTLALDFYQLDRHRESAESFLKVRQTTLDPVLATRAIRMLGIVASTNLRISELRELLAKTSQTETKALITVRLAERILQTGDAKGAKVSSWDHRNLAEDDPTSC